MINVPATAPATAYCGETDAAARFVAAGCTVGSDLPAGLDATAAGPGGLGDGSGASAKRLLLPSANATRQLFGVWALVAEDVQALVDVCHVDQAVADDRVAPGHRQSGAELRVSLPRLRSARSELGQPLRMGGVGQVEDLQAARVPADEGELADQGRIVAGVRADWTVAARRRVVLRAPQDADCTRPSLIGDVGQPRRPVRAGGRVALVGEEQEVLARHLDRAVDVAARQRRQARPDRR